MLTRPAVIRDATSVKSLSTTLCRKATRLRMNCWMTHLRISLLLVPTVHLYADDAGMSTPAVVLLRDEQRLLLDRTTEVSSVALCQTGAINCMTVNSRSKTHSSTVVHILPSENAAIWAAASNVVEHVQWLGAEPGESRMRSGRLAVYLPDGSGWCGALDAVSRRVEGDEATSLAAHLRAAVSNGWLRGSTSRTVTVVKRAAEDGVIVISGRETDVTSRGISLRNASISKDGFTTVMLLTRHRELVLAAQLTEDEREEVWSAATTLAATVPADPPRMGWSGERYGISIRRESVDGWWSRYSRDPSVLGGPELNPMYELLVRTLSNAFERIPLDARRIQEVPASP